MAETGTRVSDAVVGPGGTPSETEGDDFVPGTDDEDQLKLVRPSTLPPDEQIKIFKNWLKADNSHSADWRQEAKECFDFRSGEQWNSEDRQILNAQNRPAIVFNRVLTMLKAVAGMEINGRHEVAFLPRNNADTRVNELLTGASKWMGDECDAEDEESSAFEDCCTCGMGWTENRLDYEIDQSGLYIEEKIDALEMYWDRTARKKNLTDARRVARVRKIPLHDAMSLFPGKTREQLDATWMQGTEWDQARKTLEEKRKREENTTDTTFDDMYEVTVVNLQWWEREKYWMMADPVTNQKSELSEQEYKQFSRVVDRMKMLGTPMQFVSVQMTRRKYFEGYLGNEVLSVGKSPIEGEFKWQCITGELDHSKGTFFGLAKVMMDPQRWANKWLSQSLHILNTNAKGGIMAEQDAFEDIRKTEDNWARSDTIIWTKRGALSGDRPKVMPRPYGQFHAGHFQLMEFAITAIRDVTGINLELLGMKDVNQPGILEAQRKQAGMTVLATLFDSLRRFRKKIGRIRLYIIQTYISDGRMVRVVGPEGAQAVPLMKSKVEGDYNVVIEDAPTSPNQKEANWQIIVQMLPAFKDQLVQNPELLLIVLEYSPLPTKLIDAFRQKMMQVNPQQQQQQNLQMAALTAKINQTQADAEFKMAQAGKQQSTAMYDIAVAMHEFMRAHADNDLTAAKAAESRVSASIDALTPIDQSKGGQSLVGHLAGHPPLPPQPQSGQNGGAPGAAAPTPGMPGQPASSAPVPASASRNKPLPAGAMVGNDGRHYLHDPARPGKFLLVAHGA